MGRIWLAAAVCAAGWAVPAAAATPRELLTQASFGDRDRAQALGRVEAAERIAAQTVQRAPGDAEAALMRATATGYRAKLTGSRSQAVDARRQFEAILRRDPRNAETQLALGAWHMGAVNQLGRIVARAALGAQRSLGLAALDRGIALGGDHAFFAGLGGLLRTKADPADPLARTLLERATRAGVTTPLDRILQRAAGAVLAPLRAGRGDEARALASRLLPMGQLPGER